MKNRIENQRITLVSHYSKYESSHKKYQNSEKGKVARKRYQDSEKGKAARKRHHLRKKMIEQMSKEVLTGVIDEMSYDEIVAEVRRQTQ